MTAARVRGIVALLAVAATAVALAARVPAAVRGFDQGASYGARHHAYGGALAAADSVAIDNEFVVQALDDVPRNATYALLLSSSPQIAQQNYQIGTDTYLALPGMMFEVLLPRMPVAVPAKGDYILCYACDTSPYEGRTHWLWRDAYGHKIGLVEH